MYYLLLARPLCSPLTLHIQQLVFSGYLRGGFGGAVGLAVISSLMFWTGVLDDEALSGIVRYLGPIHSDFFRRNFPVQRDFDFGVGHPARDGGGFVGAQVDNLKMDGRGDEQLIFV